MESLKVSWKISKKQQPVNLKADDGFKQKKG